jgi:hypothetical protein
MGDVRSAQERMEAENAMDLASELKVRVFLGDIYETETRQNLRPCLQCRNRTVVLT